MHAADDPFELWERVTALRDSPDTPYWAFAWAGGQALARYLLDHPVLVKGRAVLDLAAGSGLVAIAASLAGARSVLATDIDALAIDAIQLNATTNNAAVQVRKADVLDHDPSAWDVVVAGDVFYERLLGTRVLPFLERSQVQGATVLVGDPERPHFPRERFELLATYEVPMMADLESSSVKRSSVWRLP